MLTREQVEKALPSTLRTAVTQTMVDDLNNITQDPTFAEHYRDNFITYSMVLQEGKFKVEQYFNAMKYCTYKMLGKTNTDAYALTFPAKYADWIANGTSSKDISAYIAGYHKSKLVMLILEKALIPVHVLYQDVYHDAIKVQADLMVTATSEKVRSDAANSILTHLAKPKEAAPTVAVQINNESGMLELKNALSQLAQQQLTMIDNGVPAKQLAEQKLIKSVDDE